VEAVSTQPSDVLAGVSGVMGPINGAFVTVEALFAAEHDRLVAGLAVAFDVASAEDAVQEAFIAADRKWSRVRSLDDPAGWVRRTALNRLLNGRRNERRRAEILSAVRPVPPEDGRVEQLVDLKDGLAAMPPRMRAAMCLHYVSGLRVAEVADAMDVSPGTVKSTLHDGRRWLASHMEGVRHG
jgi:RNA polymerase sigma-70 factor (ECF subfamily)